MIIAQCTEGVLRFVTVRGRRLTGAGTRPLPDGEASRALFGELSRRGGGPETLLVLPRRQVILKCLTLPAQDPEEIRRMVDLQIASMMPFPREEAVYDSVAGRAGADGYTRVTVAVVRRETAAGPLALLERAGLRPVRVGVSAFGLAGWAARLTGADEAVLAVSGDAVGVEMCFCRGGEVLFSRAFGLPSGAGRPEEVHRQTALTAAGFREACPGVEVRRVLMDVPAETADTLQAAAAVYFSCPAQKAAALDIFPVGERGAGEANAGGAALAGFGRDPRAGADLILTSVAEARRARLRRGATARFAGAGLLVLVSAALAVGADLRGRARDAAALRRDSAVFEAPARAARNRLALQTLLREARARQIWAAEVMRVLDGVLPEMTSLTFLQITGDRLTVQGQAADNSAVHHIQQGMVASPFLAEVTLQYANRRRRFDAEYTDFRFSARLTGRREGERP